MKCRVQLSVRMCPRSGFTLASCTLTSRSPLPHLAPRGTHALSVFITAAQLSSLKFEVPTLLSFATERCLCMRLTGEGREERERGSEEGGGRGEREKAMWPGSEWGEGRGREISTTSAADGGGERDESPGEETGGEEEKEVAIVFQRRWIGLYPY